jgi:hypothetical protein
MIKTKQGTIPYLSDLHSDLLPQCRNAVQCLFIYELPDVSVSTSDYIQSNNGMIAKWGKIGRGRLQRNCNVVPGSVWRDWGKPRKYSGYPGYCPSRIKMRMFPLDWFCSILLGSLAAGMGNSRCETLRLFNMTDFSAFHIFQTSTVAHSATCSMGTGALYWGKVAGAWSWPLTSTLTP